MQYCLGPLRLLEQLRKQFNKATPVKMYKVSDYTWIGNELFLKDALNDSTVDSQIKVYLCMPFDFDYQDIKRRTKTTPLIHALLSGHKHGVGISVLACEIAYLLKSGAEFVWSGDGNLIAFRPQHDDGIIYSMTMATGAVRKALLDCI